MNTDTRPASYPLRLEPDARAKLEAIAKANGRSLNAQIVLILDGFLQSEGGHNMDNPLEARMFQLEKTMKALKDELLSKI
ncbi:MAG: hypothetical protein BWK73_50880 [Thiothrix lacustris]|uniref:Arc-like DNA binding domain-containing protein n=1 Tax=Thiothrix lacustris TaxID=525917 RepID=A0A1Y1Q8F1_9GAMM|nr:MAG: hypothetical protein BWK73_50880 [Thiothrix lacustris]